VLLTVALGASLSAHRRDEYLQAARIGIAPEHVALEFDLTPGIAVADDVINAIDRNRDGAFSPEEQRAYVEPMLDRLSLTLDVAAEPLHLDIVRVSFPDAASMRQGDGTIAIQAAAAISRPAAGQHRLLFRNRNEEAKNIYLANALVPDDDSVSVTGQDRDGTQSELAIEFAVKDEAAASGRKWLWIGTALMGVCVGSRLARNPRRDEKLTERR
jgi:hypothetical protein